MNINDQDLEIKTRFLKYEKKLHGSDYLIEVKVKHIPSGIVVTNADTRSSSENKARCLEQIKNILSRQVD